MKQLLGYRGLFGVLAGAGVALCVYGLASLLFRMFAATDDKFDLEDPFLSISGSGAALVLGAILVVVGLFIAARERG